MNQPNKHDNDLVYIIILIFNNKEEVTRCVQSLEEATYPNFQVVLVDNNSPDGGGPELETRFPKHEFIFNEENLGFARGCNVGIRHALEQGADYVLLLNGDMVVEPGFLNPLVDLMEHNAKAGLASGKIFSLRIHGRLWYAGGFIQLWRGTLVVPDYGREDHCEENDPKQTGFCTGAMMFIRREVLLDVGLLPDEYFFGVEEWDYSLHVRQQGYELYFVPNAIAYHVAGVSGNPKDMTWFFYNYYRNKLIFQRKYLPSSLFWLWRIVFLLYIFLILPVRTPIVQKGRVSSRHMVYSAIHALKDQAGTNPVQLYELRTFAQRLN